MQEKRIIIPEVDYRHKLYSDKSGEEFIDTANNDHYFWHDFKTDKIYPQKTFNCEANEVGSLELIGTFDDFNMTKKSQNSQRGQTVMSVEGDAKIRINNAHEMMTYWLVSNQTLSGEPLTNTLKLSTMLDIRHDNLLRTLYELMKLNKEEFGGDYEETGDVIEARYVNRKHAGINGVRRHRYYILSKKVTMIMIGKLPGGKIKDILNIILVDFFNSYHDTFIEHAKKNEINLKKKGQTESALALGRAVKGHYMGKHHLKKSEVPYGVGHRTIYSIIGLPKRYRNGCTKYFTFEFRRYLAIIQDELSDILMDKKYVLDNTKQSFGKIDVRNHELVRSLLNDGIITMLDEFVPDITANNTYLLDRLVKAGTIKLKKPKGKGLSS